MVAKFSLPFILLSLLASLGSEAAPDTVSVYFPFNKSALTEAARQRLDRAIYDGAITETQPVQIIGYADKVGSHSDNLRLSGQRAAGIKAYLIQSGFKSDHIILIIGKGEAGAHAVSGSDGNSADRRVDIIKARTPAPVVAGPPPAMGPRSASSVDISTLSAGETVVLDKIYFEGGRHFFRKESNEALDALYKTLAEHPHVRIKIEGYICCSRPDEQDGMDEDTHKADLSVNRAIAVRNYLIRKGIAAGRLEYEGLARRNPIFPDERTEKEMQQNRRVEIRVIK